MTDEAIWKGAEQVRPFLRPLTDLHVHPRNPRRGNVDEIAKSLARFGQVRLVLIDEDGTIVAGNHTYLGAAALGWTHVGAVVNRFSSPEEASSYLLADNRIGDVGEYENAELRALLEELDAVGNYDGTGYVADDLAQMRALDELASAPVPALPPAQPPPNLGVPTLRELVLLYTDEQQTALAAAIKTLRRSYGLEGVTETVLRAVGREALRLNQGVE